MSEPTSRAVAEHYTWGQACDGWHLVRDPALGVIEERMPPGTAEVRHRHARSRQFFYVLAGRLTVEVEGAVHSLGAFEGIEVAPGDAHQVINAGADDARFLVVSTPPTAGDRSPAPASAPPVTGSTSEPDRVHTRRFGTSRLGASETRALLDWALAHGADELTMRVMSIGGVDAPFADAVEDALDPWARAVAERPVLVGADDPLEPRPVRLWALTASSVTQLVDLLPDGLFSNRIDERGWLEDPTLFRGGALLVGVLTHEQTGVLRVTEDEARELDALGIASRPHGAPFRER